MALATTTLRRDDLATVLAPHRGQPEVRALSTDGQHTPVAAGTPVQPQLAIPAGAGDPASSFLLPLSVIVKTGTGIVPTRDFISPARPAQWRASVAM